MSVKLYKDTLEFLKKGSKFPLLGNHLRRLHQLSCMIVSCMETRSSLLDDLSLNYRGTFAQRASLLKQSKRFLSNKWVDWEGFYAPFILPILVKIASCGELVFILDGTSTAGSCSTLMLSVLWKKTAIPLVWLTKKQKKGHFSEDLHLDLIAMIRPHIPPKCRVVLLGDGEFDGSQLRKKVQSFAWEYVLRTSKDRNIDVGCGKIAHFGKITRFLGEEITWIPNACPLTNGICWHKKEFNHAIFLLTNMDLAPMACQYYQKRFKIEELFKQFKSAGFDLQKSKLQCPIRCSNLIMVLAFAFVFMLCIGTLLKEKPKQVIKQIIPYHHLKTIRPLLLAQKGLKYMNNLTQKIFLNFTNINTLIF